MDSEQGLVAERKPAVFISYSRKDMAFATKLESALKARGFEPLIDRNDIYAFEDWWERIEALISRADTVIFVLSPDAVASEVALKEITHAAALNKRFAPIVCQRVEDGKIPEPLRRLNFVFFDDPLQFEISADRLAEALTTDIRWIRQHTEYGELARRWVLTGRPKGMLLRPPALEEAERWIASRPPAAPLPTEATLDFIVKSRHAETARRKRLVTILALGLIAALTLAGYAFYQKQLAERQTEIANKNLVASKLGEANLQLTHDDLAASLKAVLEADNVESALHLDPGERSSRRTLQKVLSADRLVLHMHRFGSLVAAWPFEFLDKATLVYTTEKEGLFAVDLDGRRLLWHVDLPGFDKPQILKVSADDSNIVVTAANKLAIVDGERHEVVKRLEFPSAIRDLSLSRKTGTVAVAMDKSIVLFELEATDEQKSLDVLKSDKDRNIKRISFDRSGNHLYAAAADDYGDKSSIFEYDVALARITPVPSSDSRTIVESDELNAFMGADRVVTFSSGLTQKFGFYDASTGTVSDLRDELRDVGRITGTSVLFPASLHYANGEDFGKFTPLFSISRSLVKGDDAMTLAVHLVSTERKLLNVKELKYRPQGLERVVRCRVSDTRGYLACFLSSAKGGDWLAAWRLADQAPSAGRVDDMLRAARIALHRLQDYDAPNAPFAWEARSAR